MKATGPSLREARPAPSATPTRSPLLQAVEQTPSLPGRGLPPGPPRREYSSATADQPTPPGRRKLESASRKLWLRARCPRAPAPPPARTPKAAGETARSLGRPPRPQRASAPWSGRRPAPVSKGLPATVAGEGGSLTRAMVAVAILRPSRPPRAPHAPTSFAVSRDLGAGRGTLAIKGLSPATWKDRGTRFRGGEKQLTPPAAARPDRGVANVGGRGQRRLRRAEQV
jgi:hypothetical protein